MYLVERLDYGTGLSVTTTEDDAYIVKIYPQRPNENTYYIMIDYPDLYYKEANILAQLLIFASGVAQDYDRYWKAALQISLPQE